MIKCVVFQEDFLLFAEAQIVSDVLEKVMFELISVTHVVIAFTAYVMSLVTLKVTKCI